jgi:hypothetical protein
VGESDELGEIDVDVRVREPDVEAFVDYVAPETDDGRPVDPVREYGDRFDPDPDDY